MKFKHLINAIEFALAVYEFMAMTDKSMESIKLHLNEALSLAQARERKEKV